LATGKKLGSDHPCQENHHTKRLTTAIALKFAGAISLSYVRAIDVPSILFHPVFHTVNLALTGFASGHAVESEGDCVHISHAVKGLEKDEKLPYSLRT
jgi:hypothetical protein